MIGRKRGVVSYHPHKAKVIAAVNDCIARAQQVFGFDIPAKDIPVVFFNTGRAAGWARCLPNGGFNIEFNTRIMDADIDHIINETVPHEVAHIVCLHLFYRNVSRSPHGRVWKGVAVKLGCKGQRTHDVVIAPSRTVRRVTYVATCGTVVQVTMNMHHKIQRGQTQILRSTGGKITASNYKG
jgi:predicted SprT family Zn-dependent metalloprotease